MEQAIGLIAALVTATTAVVQLVGVMLERKRRRYPQPRLSNSPDGAGTSAPVDDNPV